MGRETVITDAVAEQLLALQKAGGSRREMAKATGISIGSVNRFFGSLGVAAAPVVVQRQAVIEQAGSSLWNTKHALDTNYQRVLMLIERLERGIVESDGETSSPTPIATHVAALREAREHIKTSLSLLKLMVDVDEVRKFQQVVIEAIGEADEATKQRILAKLTERRALGFAFH